LLAQTGEALSREQLCETLGWPLSSDGARNIDGLIYRLRRKFPELRDSFPIKAVRNAGYAAALTLKAGRDAGTPR
jgi:DNA-binding response OmpR family regulator